MLCWLVYDVKQWLALLCAFRLDSVPCVAVVVRDDTIGVGLIIKRGRVKR